MSEGTRVGSAGDQGTRGTLEEQLRRTHDQLCLVADLFDLQAVAPDAGWPEGLSPAACAALSGLYRQASQELGATVDALPAAVLNRAVDRRPGPTPVEADAGPVPPGRGSTEDGRDHHDGGDR